MPSDPFTIRIYVPDGDPEGVRLIDRLNLDGDWNCRSKGEMACD
jgi:hypothetical protein